MSIKKSGKKNSVLVRDETYPVGTWVDTLYSIMKRVCGIGELTTVKQC